MHRSAIGPAMFMGGLALLLSAVGPPASSRAQSCSAEEKPLVVLINSAVRLQMSSRKNIKLVNNPKEGILNIRTVDRDPSTILLGGAAPGVTRIDLEDVDGFRESRLVVVQADVEYLTRQLKAAIPQSSITVTPNGATSVILTGYLGRAEEIAVAQQAAQGLGFTVVNNLRINGVQQVQLDVVIARVRRTKARNFGFNFLQNSRNQLFGSTVGNLLPNVAGGTVGVPGSVLQPTTSGQVISASPGNVNLFGGVIGRNSGFLFFLQALETEGLAKVLSQPRLVTKSGQPASFLDGGEQAVPVPAGLGQVGVQFEEFGTRLNFLPIVLGNGRIHLEVEPEVSALDANAGVAIAGATVAGRATQRIHTTIEMESGQTFVIGGLIQKLTNANASKVPLLGQLPFIGAAFSTKSFNDDESELVVMVTPHLVDAQSACQVVKVLPGQESRSPSDFELFFEGLLEAPRGPRAIFQNGRYVPAHFGGPTANLFPCAGQYDGKPPPGAFGSTAGCGAAGCSAAGCGTPATAAPAAAAPAPHAGPVRSEVPSTLPPVRISSRMPTGEEPPPAAAPSTLLGGSLNAAMPLELPKPPLSANR